MCLEKWGVENGMCQGKWGVWKGCVRKRWDHVGGVCQGKDVSGKVGCVERVCQGVSGNIGCRDWGMSGKVGCRKRVCQVT